MRSDFIYCFMIFDQDRWQMFLDQFGQSLAVHDLKVSQILKKLSVMFFTRFLVAFG